MRKPSSTRGLQPVIDEDTIAAWSLDGSLASFGRDVLGGFNFGQIGPGPLPTIVDGVIGDAKRFNGTTQGMDAPGDAATSNRLNEDNPATYHVWVRFTGDNTGYDTFFRYGGIDGDGSQPLDNILFQMEFGNSRNLSLFYENTSGGGNNNRRLVVNFDLVMQLFQWNYIAWTKEPTVAGAAGNVDWRCYVNSQLVDTFLDQDAPEGGTQNPFWTIGSGTASGNPVNECPCDISAAQCEGRVLSVDELEENFRLGILYTTPSGLPGVVHSRVELEDGQGFLQDMGDLDDEDWVTKASFSGQADSPTLTARVDLKREIGRKSLGPLVTNSMMNLSDLFVLTSTSLQLYHSRALVMNAARIPMGIDLIPAQDYQEVFRGETDDVDWSKDPITITARDQGHALVDTIIEEIVDQNTNADPKEAFSYGNDTVGVSLQAVIQQILDDNDNIQGNDTVPGLRLRTGSYSPITLDTPVDPLWQLRKFLQRREPVMTAIRNAAGQIAFECRFRWDEETESFLLTLFEPDRSKLDVDSVLIADDLVTVSRFAVSRIRMRNAIEVTIPSEDVLNQDGERLLDSKIFEDTGPNLVKNRRRFMGVQEASSSIISSPTERDRMGDGILAELKDPEIEVGMGFPLMFEQELTDLPKLKGDAIHYTGDQRVAVVSFAHTFERDNPNTALGLRGKPSVGFKRWLELDTRPGQARPPTRNPLESLAERSNSELLAGQNNIVDRTDFQTGAKLIALPNHNFSMISRGPNYLPDGFTLLQGTFGTEVEIDETLFESGGRSLKFTEDGAGTPALLDSALIPIKGGDKNPLVIELTQAKAVVGDNRLRVSLLYFNGDRSFNAASVESFIPPFGGAPINTFIQNRTTPFTPPAGVAFCKVRVQPEFITNPADHYLDTISVYALSTEFYAFNVFADTGIAENTYTQVMLDDDSTGPGHDYGNNFDTGLFQFVTPVDGLYDFTAGLLAGKDAGGGSAPDTLSIRLMNNGVQFAESPENTAFRTLFIPGPGNGDYGRARIRSQRFLLRGDVVTLEGRISTGSAAGTRVFAGGDNDSFLSGKLLSTE